MRRWIAILLLLIYSLGATELDQLLRFPLLVKHFVIHKSQNPGMTFGMFMKMHYLDPQLFDGDYQEDMQLPFKQADDHCLILPTVVPEPPVAASYTIQALPYEYNLFSNPYNPLLNKGNIIKPPRA
jgi:hypothetical protein